MRITIFLFFTFILFSTCSTQHDKRKQLKLNGDWHIVKTALNSEIPGDFSSIIPVPGLADLAVPELDHSDSAFDNSLYWYKKTFKVNDAEWVRLKINMAKYHTRVYLNNHFVGENVYNFTPALFDLKPFLKAQGQENELIISVGCRNNLPDTVINGNDFEKIKYIPGIYDDVKIIATGYPHISDVQVVPDIEKGTVRVVANCEKSSPEQEESIEYVIRELLSGRVVSKGKYDTENQSMSIHTQLDFNAPLSEVNLWTPENPFLYQLELETAGDNVITRFGMRTFTVNSEGGTFLLNGKPYYMRGTNVCIHRFFEDPERNALPWDDDWVIKLHQRFKEMNWNSMRYCIGLPPERWYDIADSLGFLIQNEYPIWAFTFENVYPEVTAKRLANEFRSWLPHHWNHPSVVIWDAQNETRSPVTTEAIKRVRDMDLSNRLWENGWSVPAGSHDPIESHPYLFMRYSGEGQPSEQGAPLADFLYEVITPNNDVNQHNRKEGEERYKNSIIINEYAWLWLNRDGSTTTLTDRVYNVCFGKGLSREERIDIYAKHLGMLTEYWRAHRQCAGVLHFCGLAYSRPEEPRGQTSDHFIDIKNLTYEPKFEQYVKPAFAPVGLMINFWNKNIEGGSDHEFEIYAINDLIQDWQGMLRFSIDDGSGVISSSEHEIRIPATGRIILNAALPVPALKGDYHIIAEIEVNGQSVKSIRDVIVGDL